LVWHTGLRGLKMLDRMDQRDAAKGCTHLLALFGISDAPGQEASARLPRARSSDPNLAALAEIADPVIAHPPPRHHRGRSPL
jgi:hypothetical protein